VRCAEFAVGPTRIAAITTRSPESKPALVGEDRRTREPNRVEVSAGNRHRRRASDRDVKVLEQISGFQLTGTRPEPDRKLLAPPGTGKPRLLVMNIGVGEVAQGPRDGLKQQADQHNDAEKPNASPPPPPISAGSAQRISPPHNVVPITGRAGTEPRSTDRNYTAGPVRCIGGLCGGGGASGTLPHSGQRSGVARRS
jgi:hypothetical protein